MNLHAYWDGMFGAYATVDGTIQDIFKTRRDKSGRAILKVFWASDTLAAVSDPEDWAQENFDLAKRNGTALQNTRRTTPGSGHRLCERPPPAGDIAEGEGT
ncbi:hypothetical protein [Rhizobium gallicum]|uniref:Uncharacterized protein n=1 Tax=Rhizobium gallicum bv. gallicum R602sp TaxID=1041138 RepID=A0A0B4XAK9_9HYPH|nr:hypothetical protein [Rhizobium gallicum]AJD43562.1 hypothetical protein RGR602_PB00020 [Rhizobium gallicum bv. gallicum R602sp]